MNYKKKILTNKREKRGFTEYPQSIANVNVGKKNIGNIIFCVRAWFATLVCKIGQ